MIVDQRMQRGFVTRQCIIYMETTWPQRDVCFFFPSSRTNRSQNRTLWYFASPTRCWQRCHSDSCVANRNGSRLNFIREQWATTVDENKSVRYREIRVSRHDKVVVNLLTDAVEWKIVVTDEMVRRRIVERTNESTTTSLCSEMNASSRLTTDEFRVCVVAPNTNLPLRDVSFSFFGIANREEHKQRQNLIEQYNQFSRSSTEVCRRQLHWTKILFSQRLA